jgi:hypothetical protein
MGKGWAFFLPGAAIAWVGYNIMEQPGVLRYAWGWAFMIAMMVGGAGVGVVIGLKVKKNELEVGNEDAAGDFAVGGVWYLRPNRVPDRNANHVILRKCLLFAHLSIRSLNVNSKGRIR